MKIQPAVQFVLTDKHLLLCCRSLNSLYSPSVIAGMTPGYASALEMHDLDKSAINGKGIVRNNA